MPTDRDQPIGYFQASIIRERLSLHILPEKEEHGNNMSRCGTLCGPSIFIMLALNETQLKTMLILIQFDSGQAQRVMNLDCL